MPDIVLPATIPFQHLVTIEEKEETVENGVVVRTYQTNAENVSAWIHAGEPSREDEPTSRRTSRIARGYFPIGTAIEEGWRVLFEGVTYYVEGVRDPAGLGSHIEADLEVEE